jgi:hypothetical protein
MSETYKTIIRNQSFGKGMTMSMKLATNDIGSSLHTHNSYFGGSVYQVFHTNTNITEIRTQTQMMYSPNWLQEKLGSIGSPASRSLLIKDKDVSITFTSHSGQLVSNVKEKGMILQGNIENINSLKHFKQRLNHARDIIKYNSIEDIMNCELSSSTNTSSVSNIFSACVHTLDVNKFFDLKWK